MSGRPSVRGPLAREHLAILKALARLPGPAPEGQTEGGPWGLRGLCNCSELNPGVKLPEGEPLPCG